MDAEGHEDWSTDAAEESLNRLIERRAEEREEANREATAWRASEVRFRARRESEIRSQWVRYYRRQAVLFRSLAAENEARALRLISGAEGGGGGGYG